MRGRLGIGLPLYSDPEYLELARGLAEEEADYFEVNPEMLWRREPGGLVRNAYHDLFREIRERSRKPFVAHGLAFSPGTASGTTAGDEAWLERLRDDHACFRFEWLTEHLGWTRVDDLELTLPLPLPFTAEAVGVVAARAALLRTAVPVVGFENNADTFSLGHPEAWPDFLNEACRASGALLLLDLHNLHTQCLNFGQDPVACLDRLDLDRVVEIHLSGGSESDPAWLSSGRTFRLDSHDGPVPEEVWRLLDLALPRCRNLRGIVVERLHGSFGRADLPLMIEDLRRARRLFPC